METNELVNQLRDISDAIQDDVLFPAPDGGPDDIEPLFDAALYAIEKGGTATAGQLAALLHYIADMME